MSLVPTIISKLLETATAYFTWRAEKEKNKALTARYDLENRIENDIAAIEEEITSLRATGRHADADRLRNKLARANGILADLSAPSVAPGPGAADPDR